MLFLLGGTQRLVRNTSHMKSDLLHRLQKWPRAVCWFRRLYVRCPIPDLLVRQAQRAVVAQHAERVQLLGVVAAFVVWNQVFFMRCDQGERRKKTKELSSPDCVQLSYRPTISLYDNTEYVGTECQQERCCFHTDQ